jgi:hypothetical protein
MSATDRQFNPVYLSLHSIPIARPDCWHLNGPGVKWQEFDLAGPFLGFTRGPDEQKALEDRRAIVISDAADKPLSLAIYLNKTAGSVDLWP